MTTSSISNTTEVRDVAAMPCLPQEELSALQLQRTMGHLAVLPLSMIVIAVLRFGFKFKIPELKAIRQQFLEFTKSKRPIVICPNHLTMIDSVVLLWALASSWTYLLDFRLFSWNVPAFENFKKRMSWRIITYLTKCIPIDRKGSASHVDSVFKKLVYLLKTGDLCMVFPEGTRSRTGRIDIASTGYGIGKIVRDVPNCLVLCIYMRGHRQDSYSDFPQKNSSFYLKMEALEPTSTSQGLRAVKEYSTQVITKIKEMEDQFFSLHA